MQSESQLLSLVGDIYDCAIEPAKWPQALLNLAESVGCRAIGVSTVDPRSRGIRVLMNPGFTPREVEVLTDAMRVNPLLSISWFTEIDEPVTGVSYLEKSEYEATSFYRDFIQPLGL